MRAQGAGSRTSRTDRELHGTAGSPERWCRGWGARPAALPVLPHTTDRPRGAPPASARASPSLPFPQQRGPPGPRTATEPQPPLGPGERCCRPAEPRHPALPGADRRRAEWSRRRGRAPSRAGRAPSWRRRRRRHREAAAERAGSPDPRAARDRNCSARAEPA